MARIRKALAAGVAAGLAAVAEAAATTGLSHLNLAVVAGVVLTAGLAVWRVPNKPVS